MLHFLPRDERLRYDRQCDALLGDAMAALLAADAPVDAREWRVIGRREQLTVHRAARAQPAADGSGARLNVLARGFLPGTLAQLAEGLAAETDEELLTAQALVSGARVAVRGAAVLNVAERATPRARFRFAGVRWCSWTREGREGEGEREGEQDLLSYERLGVTHDDEDREVAYHVVRSIDRPEWPLFVARPPGLRRADLALCFVFRAVATDLVQCLVTGSYHARGSSATQRTADIAIAERVLTVTRALRAYEARKLSRLIDKAQDRQVAMAKSCLRCGARRTVLDPHRNCAICKKSVCNHCRQVKHIFKTNMNTRIPESEAFCNVCLKRAHLPSAIGNQQHHHHHHHHSSHSHSSPSEPKTPEPRQRASLPANLEYKNYDRLLQSFAQRRPRSSSELSAPPPYISNSSSSSKADGDSRVEVNSGSSKSEDHSSGEFHKKPLAIPIDQLVKLRRERDTVLSFPLARTVVEQELYLAPADDENNKANANAAEKAFRHHRERQQQLEDFERPNPLHQRMLEEQQRRREYNAMLGRKTPPPPMSPRKDVGPEKTPDPEESSHRLCEDPPVTRRRAATDPHDASSREDERFLRATSTMPYLMPSSRGAGDSFLNDLYARF